MGLASGHKGKSLFIESRGQFCLNSSHSQAYEESDENASRNKILLVLDGMPRPTLQNLNLAVFILPST